MKYFPFFLRVSLRNDLSLQRKAPCVYGMLNWSL